MSYKDQVHDELQRRNLDTSEVLTPAANRSSDLADLERVLANSSTTWNALEAPSTEEFAQVPIIKPVQELEALELSWLWPKRLPWRKVSLLTGDAGEGKSLVTVDLMARLTAGRDWPDEWRGDDPVDVLLLTSEVGLDDVLRPRLKLAGADLSRIHLFSEIVSTDPYTHQQRAEKIDLCSATALLSTLLTEHPGIGLIVIDPLSEFIGPAASSSHQENRLHNILVELHQLAVNHDLSILCVEATQTVGLEGVTPKNQWSGRYDSIFQAVWGIVRDPRHRSRRLFLPIRHQLGDDRNGLQFSILPGDGTAAVVQWGEEENALSYAEACGRGRTGRGIWRTSQTNHAEVWLRSYLANGERPSVDLFEEAQALGFSEHPVRTALRRIAEKKKHGRGAWFWKLCER